MRKLIQLSVLLGIFCLPQLVMSATDQLSDVAKEELKVKTTDQSGQSEIATVKIPQPVDEPDYKVSQSLYFSISSARLEGVSSYGERPVTLSEQKSFSKLHIHYRRQTSWDWLPSINTEFSYGAFQGAFSDFIGGVDKTNFHVASLSIGPEWSVLSFGSWNFDFRLAYGQSFLTQVSETRIADRHLQEEFFTEELLIKSPTLWSQNLRLLASFSFYQDLDKSSLDVNKDLVKLGMELRL